MSIENELDRLLSEDAPERTQFRIEDDHQAEWALQKLAERQLELSGHREFADAEIALVNLWFADRAKAVENNINYFVSLLEDYAQRERRFKERKSIPLPHGKIATREGRQSWDVNHDDFLPWARINRPDLMRVVEEPKLKEMKALLEVVGDRVVDPTSGEVVAGVVITQAEMSITITTNKGE
jgi:hypothetical protein